jgi:hypothetical protein
LAYAAGLASKDDLAAQGMSTGTPKDQTAPGGSLDGDPIDSLGLRNRRPQQRRESVGPASSQGMQRMEGFAQENNVPGAMGTSEVWDEQGMDVKPPRNRASDGGWVARLAAMLVGEDPTQCYALICKKCHAHNGEIVTLCWLTGAHSLFLWPCSYPPVLPHFWRCLHLNLFMV